MSLKIAQNFDYQGKDWWKWAVWVDGPAKELDQVKEVTYTLDPTFADPVRTVRDRDSKFRLKTQGWGVFPIHVKIAKKSGEAVMLKHNLVLEYPDGTRNIK